MNMLKRRGFIAFLASCFVLPCLPEDAPDHTLGLLNGRWWRKTTFDMRLGFVFGYSQRRAASACLGQDEWFKTTAATGEIVDALNEFYNEPANAAIPIYGAWEIFAMKFNGKTSSEIQHQTEIARQISSEGK